MANTYGTTFQSSEEIAQGTRVFHLAKPDSFEFRAGQSIDLVIPEPKYRDDEGNMRSFSIASAPHEPELLVATRMRDTAYKNTLKEMQKGSNLSIEGPFGSFFLHKNEARPAVFLAGGIGVTPFRSMALDAAHRSLPHKIYLFYSNRRPEDAPFLDELRSLQNVNYTYVPTMTEMELSGQSWDGERGYISMEMIDRHMPDRSSAVYYTAGPQGMVTAMQKMLIAAGVSEDDIRFEEFPGY